MLRVMPDHQDQLTGGEPLSQTLATLFGSYSVSVFLYYPLAFRSSRSSAVSPVPGLALRRPSTLSVRYGQMRLVRRCYRAAMPGFETDSETTR